VLCSAYRPSSKDVGKQDAKAVREKIEQRELEPEALRMKIKTLGKLVQSRKDVQRARSQARSWMLLERLGAVFGEAFTFWPHGVVGHGSRRSLKQKLRGWELRGVVDAQETFPVFDEKKLRFWGSRWLRGYFKTVSYLPLLRTC
jgi:hypothetical protein